MPPSLHRSVIVGPQAAGMRADAFLAARFEGVSRTTAARAIREGRVRSTARALKPSTPLRLDEALVVDLPELAPREEKPPCPPLLHEDARVLVFDKPPGLLMHPVGQAFTWGLINLAREAFPGEALHLAHRLDKETSGVCVVARDDEANRRLKLAFKARETRKTYLALVRGRPAWSELTCEAPIGDDAASPIRLKQGVRADGLPAVTRFEVLERRAGLSLVACHPLTGRTHQLRVHLDHLGHPILGDKLYGQPPELFLRLWEGLPPGELAEGPGHPRHCLHASELRIPHPDGGALHVRSPLPEDMRRALAEAPPEGAPG